MHWGVAVVMGLLAMVAWFALTEGSYLAPGVVRWIYDHTAGSYEKKWRRKAYCPTRATQDLLLIPLREALADLGQARMADLACGTGRMTRLVLQQPWFHGRITAMDLSPAMLSKLRDRLSELDPQRRARVIIEQIDLAEWTAPRDSAFDVVTLMEASEMIPGFRTVVASVASALKPGGLFLLTKPPDSIAWLFFGRAQTNRQLRLLLLAHGFTEIAIRPWRWRYSVVSARMGPKSESGGDVNGCASSAKFPRIVASEKEAAEREKDASMVDSDRRACAN